MYKKSITLAIVGSLLINMNLDARVKSFCDRENGVEFILSDGMKLLLSPVDDNAVRVRMYNSEPELPEWVYVGNNKAKYTVSEKSGTVDVVLPGIKVVVDKESGMTSYYSGDGKKLLLSEEARSLVPSTVQGMPTYVATQTFDSPKGESLFGLGQFQDNISDVRGVSRRLTQVNTQISVPVIVSNMGYGLLWNNYGMTEFNPSSAYVELTKGNEAGVKEVVNVTSAEGGVTETRESNVFHGKLHIPEAGHYSLLLDVGQNMARKHDLSIGNKKVFSVNNLWLPPTASCLVYLDAGDYPLTAQLEKDDQPKVYFRKVDNTTTFQSPVAESIDYTVMCGTPDEAVASYRRLTGSVPMMPDWAMGYIHCRERFHNQDELITTAQRFRKESTPIDLIVQDWQYWGKYGWNSMTFDEADYPSPREMTDSLHGMDIHLMVSVWSKVDPDSEVGGEMENKGYFIPETSWVDFFNPEAAACYWKNFSNRLLKPVGIDAWWQDATEPENDDLKGRKIAGGKIPGEVYRNTYPLLVNKTVYEGSRKDSPDKRTMILTRSAFPGMQRYATATWSGDVGWDWDAFRRQITAGLGMSISGQPWWTYDAGGFFRPGDQYTSKDYHELMVRWIQTSVFLPLMRVHGYMTDTEYWNYDGNVPELVKKAIAARYTLSPYLYSENARISFDNSTILRPLMMDFTTDTTALRQKYQYMFGPSLLVAPVVEPGIDRHGVYLPKVAGGWYDFHTADHIPDCGWYDAAVSDDHIPVFVKAGTVLPLASGTPQTVREALDSTLIIHVYGGNDGNYTIYEDEGVNYNYEKGDYSRIKMTWNDSASSLTIDARDGKYPGMSEERDIKVVRHTSDSGCEEKNIRYKGKKLVVRF